MPSFSRKSLERLEGVDKRLQDLAFKVLQVHDCTVIYGLRTEEEQRKLVAEGKSRTMNSRHLTGHAIDLAPYPIDWDNTHRFYWFAGMVLALAHEMDIPIRWGGDWAGNGLEDKQQFNDLVHFEIPRGKE